MDNNDEGNLINYIESQSPNANVPIDNNLSEKVHSDKDEQS